MPKDLDRRLTVRAAPVDTHYIAMTDSASLRAMTAWKYRVVRTYEDIVPMLLAVGEIKTPLICGTKQ